MCLFLNDALFLTWAGEGLIKIMLALLSILLPFGWGCLFVTCETPSHVFTIVVKLDQIDQIVVDLFYKMTIGLDVKASRL